MYFEVFERAMTHENTESNFAEIATKSASNEY